MTAKTYLFEGEQRTVSEVRKMVPRLSDARIRDRLERGETTRMQMMLDRPRPRHSDGQLRFNGGRRAK